MVLLAGLGLEADLGPRLADPHRTHAGRRVRQLRVTAEALLHRVHQRFVLEVAGGRDHDVRADVAVGVVLAHHLRVHRIHGVGRADHRPAQRVVREHRGRDQVMGEVVVAVLVHRDLLKHDLPLRDQLVAVERRRQQHVAHHVQRSLEVGVQHACVEHRVLLGGGRVQLAAQPVEDLGDLDTGKPRRALEQQVLDEVADAGVGGALVARAGTDPHADRYGPHRPHTLGDDPLSAVERGYGISLHSPHSSSGLLAGLSPLRGGAWGASGATRG